MKFVLEIEISDQMDTKRAADIANDMLIEGLDITKFYCSDVSPRLSVLSNSGIMIGLSGMEEFV
jgi:hypothetical protein